MLSALFDLINDRRLYVKSLVKMAKNQARTSIVKRSLSANPLMNETATAEDVKPTVQYFNFDEDSLLELGPNDSLEPVTAGTGPTHPGEVDRLVMGTLGQRAGLSRMAVSGDFSEATYSSARFADLNDKGVWESHQEIILRVVRYMYEQWPLRFRYELSFRDYYTPPHPYIDPARTANVNKMLVDMGAKSLTEVIEEDGRDPETVFRLIAEDKRRQAEMGQTTAPASSPEE